MAPTSRHVQHGRKDWKFQGYDTNDTCLCRWNARLSCIGRSLLVRGAFVLYACWVVCPWKSPRWCQLRIISATNDTRTNGPHLWMPYVWIAATLSKSATPIRWRSHAAKGCGGTNESSVLETNYRSQGGVSLLPAVCRVLVATRELAFGGNTTTQVVPFASHTVGGRRRWSSSLLSWLATTDFTLDGWSHCQCRTDGSRFENR